MIYQCPFYLFTGIHCPGCGMTRSLLALLHLDIKKAFYFHPLFPVVILFIIFLFLRFLKLVQISAAQENRLLWGIAAIFIITYFVRLSLQSPVVAINLSHGLIYKAFHALVKLI